MDVIFTSLLNLVSLHYWVWAIKPHLGSTSIGCEEQCLLLFEEWKHSHKVLSIVSLAVKLRTHYNNTHAVRVCYCTHSNKMFLNNKAICFENIPCCVDSTCRWLFFTILVNFNSTYTFFLHRIVLSEDLNKTV